MDLTLMLVLVVLVYVIALFLFMRFFAFIRSCDSEMRTMIDNKRIPPHFAAMTPRKKRSRKTRAPRFAAV